MSRPVIVIEYNAQPWTENQLEIAQRGTSVAILFHRHQRTSHEADLARWTLLGRSYEEALTILNGGEGSGGVKSPAVAADV